MIQTFLGNLKALFFKAKVDKFDYCVPSLVLFNFYKFNLNRKPYKLQTILTGIK